jgi:hypothetical protein
LVIVAVAVWFVLAVLVLLTWPRSGAWRTGVALLAFAFALLQQLTFATVPDSAFVTFRYAANIAAGHGAVYNIGEYVEGYSNFAWLVLVSLPKALFGADIVTGAVVLSSACALGCVLLAGRFGRVAGLLTAAASGLAAYGCAGTEAPLFVLLVLAVLYALKTRHPLAAGVLAALAVLTRPDGLVLAALAGLWLTFLAARHRTSWGAPAGYLLGGLVLVVPWLSWRATYYEQSSASWPTLHPSFSTYAFLVAALAAVAIAQLLAHHRHPSPNPRRATRWAPVAALVLCAASLPFAANQHADVLASRSRHAQEAEISDWLATRLPPGAIISTGGGGALAYGVGARLFVITRGVGNDDYEFVASLRQPALAITAVGYSRRQHCEADPAYVGLYEVATFLREGSREWITVYPREDQAAALIERLDKDPRLVYVPCPA